LKNIYNIDIGGKMDKYITKYFGEIFFDETDDPIGLKYNGQKLYISFFCPNLYEGKVKIYLDILDKYVEINEIGRKAILENFAPEKLVELNYPDLNIYMENNGIFLSLGYKTSYYKKYWEEFNKDYVESRSKGIFIDPLHIGPLRVNMDDKLNVLEIYDEDGIKKRGK
jgi:hypothetical protein